MKYQTGKRLENLTCPKCDAGLTDLWDGEPVSAFIGEFSDDRFRCEGVKRFESCGYFGLEDLGFEIDEQ